MITRFALRRPASIHHTHLLLRFLLVSLANHLPRPVSQSTRFRSQLLDKPGVANDLLARLVKGVTMNGWGEERRSVN